MYLHRQAIALPCVICEELLKKYERKRYKHTNKTDIPSNTTRYVCQYGTLCL